ncbi:MAG: aminotransferase class I/II-fold pyridoxal phosphate-dependent enzyme [Clostridiales bacterium]|nr:aminotransferase class I/II-fold pyridoxal phosphate-dependent enzyme [Clostridiales bacterium]
MDKKPLHEALSDYCSSGMLPMHMPGGKRNTGSLASNDITEITDFDNLHAPTGIIRDLESDLASLWNAKEAFMSVNGSTAMIEAAICAAMRYHPDGKVLAASNCHLSVWRGIEVAGCMHRMIYPKASEGIPFALEILPEKIDEILSSDPSVRAVVITSPTYEGVISDTRTVHEITKKHGAVLIVDSAHGAHLGLDGFWGEDAVGDLVIKSLHKTLSSPTQTAVMLSYSGAIPSDSIRHYIDIFESTSPSYLLMGAVSEMVETIRSGNALSEWEEAVIPAENRLRDLKNIKLFRYPGKDRSKLVFICKGTLLSEILRNEYMIETESSTPVSLIAMTGMGDTMDSIRRFTDAVTAIDNGHPELALTDLPSAIFPEHVTAMTIREASRLLSRKISSKDAEGLISADYIYSYPPGIPVILPGDRITEQQISLAGGTLSVLS